MSFLNQMVRIAARMAVWKSANKLIKGVTNKQNAGRGKRRNRRNSGENSHIERQRTSPMVYILLLVVGILVLYILYNK